MEIKVKVTTDPATCTVDDFAAKVKRKRSQIDRAIQDDSLDHGEVFGKKVVVLNEKSETYASNCKLRDRIKS